MTHDSESFSRRTLAPVLLLATTLIIILSLGYPTRSAAESTIACPSGTYDMLDWMTLDSDLRATYHMEGTSNPLYTIRGTFNCSTANTFTCGSRNSPGPSRKAIRNSPTIRTCPWFQGAQPPVRLRPVPPSRFRTPITTCTQIVLTAAQ